MNILMVTLAYDPAVAFGGPVKVVQGNARELVRRGHLVTIYCTNLRDRECKIASSTLEREDQGVRVVYHNTWSVPRWRGNLGPCLSPGMIAYLLREGRAFDLIHINEARTFSTVAAALYGQVANIPYIIQAHGSFTYGLRAQRLKRIYDRAVGRMIYSRAAKIIALLPGEIAECEAVGISRDGIVVIGNGIDLAAWQRNGESGIRFRSRFCIPIDAHMVLFLGRLDRKKGPDLLVEALAKLDATDVYSVFVGPDDGYEDIVRNLALRLGLSDRVIFTGLLRDGDVKAAYAAADLFVLPARFDTFPMSIVEAAASSLPILTTEPCQVAELIRGQAGLVTPVEVEAIAKGLQRLLFDFDLRAACASGARLLAERKFTVEATVSKLEEVYQEVLEKN